MEAPSPQTEGTGTTSEALGLAARWAAAGHDTSRIVSPVDVPGLVAQEIAQGKAYMREALRYAPDAFFTANGINVSGLTQRQKLVKYLSECSSMLPDEIEATTTQLYGQEAPPVDNMRDVC